MAEPESAAGPDLSSPVSRLLLSSSSSSSPPLKVSLKFLARDPLYDDEKPYSIQYEPGDGVAATNIREESVDKVSMHDIRPLKSSLSLSEDGFTVCDLKVPLSRDDFADPEKVKGVYLPAVCEMLKRETCSANVAVLEYLIRRRHPQFPQSSGEEFVYAQPNPMAHIDFSPACIREMLEDRYGDRVDEIARHRHQVINVWRPLVSPLKDWPLSLCHPTSVHPQSDLQLLDRVYPKNVEESLLLHYSPTQQWFYLRDQRTDEALVFRTSDSELGINGGVPHCAFAIPEAPSGVSESLPRESVEVRVLVCYADVELDMRRVKPSQRHGPQATYSKPATDEVGLSR